MVLVRLKSEMHSLSGTSPAIRLIGADGTTKYINVNP